MDMEAETFPDHTRAKQATCRDSMQIAPLAAPHADPVAINRSRPSQDARGGRKECLSASECGRSGRDGPGTSMQTAARALEWRCRFGDAEGCCHARSVFLNGGLGATPGRNAASILVRKGGFEPPQGCPYWTLNPADAHGRRERRDTRCSEVQAPSSTCAVLEGGEGVRRVTPCGTAYRTIAVHGSHPF